jgi:hypothetical protein
MKRFLSILTLCLLLICITAFIISLLKLPALLDNLDLSKDANLATAINGFVSPVFNLITIVLIFYTYTSQHGINKKVLNDLNYRTTLDMITQFKREFEASSIHFDKKEYFGFKALVIYSSALSVGGKKYFAEQIYYFKKIIMNVRMIDTIIKSIEFPTYNLNQKIALREMFISYYDAMLGEELQKINKSLLELEFDEMDKVLKSVENSIQNITKNGR